MIYVDVGIETCLGISTFKTLQFSDKNIALRLAPACMILV